MENEPSNRIAPETTIGAVGLIVSDLNRSLAYYTGTLGLHVQSRTELQAVLGADSAPLLVLSEQTGAHPVQRGRTGLYHFALLLPTRADLARMIRHLVDAHAPLTGMADHGVSEALYLSDPDGHGIEIYCDRPRAEWPMLGGEVAMTVDPLDVASVLHEVTSGRITWHGMAAGTRMGHIHLHVRNLLESQTFYCDVLGFELTQAFAGQALFVSAGGYHHHIGLNVWAGVGAPPPADDAARLDWYDICLPNATAYKAVLERLRSAQCHFVEEAGLAMLPDPSGNWLRLRNGGWAGAPTLAPPA